MNDKMAEGILLENGEKVEADYVVYACDMDYTFRELLPEKYMPQWGICGMENDKERKQMTRI